MIEIVKKRYNIINKLLSIIDSIKTNVGLISEDIVESIIALIRACVYQIHQIEKIEPSIKAEILKETITNKTVFHSKIQNSDLVIEVLKQRIRKTIDEKKIRDFIESTVFSKEYMILYDSMVIVKDSSNPKGAEYIVNIYEIVKNHSEIFIHEYKLEEYIELLKKSCENIKKAIAEALIDSL